MYMYVCVYVYHMYVCVYVYVCMCVCVYVYVCLCICMYVYMYVCMYVCTYPLRVWEPHSDAGVNILLENGQYPHNSSYEAPCLPWGATREVYDGILVVESWLMSATEYIAIDHFGPEFM